MLTRARALVRRLLNRIAPRKQELAAEDREFELFLEYFGFRPAILDKKAGPEQIRNDIARIKARIAQYIEWTAQAIKRYYRAVSSPGRGKDHTALHRRADDLYFMVADACSVAHRYYPEMITDNPDEIQTIFIEFPIPRLWINIFRGWGFDIRKRL